MKCVEVVAAIIYCGDEILCMKRPEGRHAYTSLKYEFPGGKIEKGETKEDALRRELMEEMDLTVDIKDLFFTVEHTYPDYHLRMHSYICLVKNKEFVMKEHVDFKWLTKDKLNELDWALADKPIVERLMQNS